MSKYIDNTSCPQCEDFRRPYGCINSACPIRIDYDEGREEMAADLDLEKCKDERLEDE